MNEQLLELERQFQNKQITEEQYQAEKSRLEREALFLGDFDNEIKLSPLGTTPIGLSPSPDISNSSANYYRTFPNALSNILQYKGQSETTPPQNTTSVDTGIQGQDNISYNDPQYNDNQRLPLRSATIENPNLSQVDLIPSGITPSEEAKKLNLLFPNAVENIVKYTDEDGTSKKSTNIMDEFNKYIPFMNPYGSNIETELYSLGRFVGMDKGTQGRNLGIASSALSAGLGGARTLLSGLAQQKQTELSAEEIRKQLAQKNYTQQVQYMNQNNRGGVTNG